jgi:hypothetical protein
MSVLEELRTMARAMDQGNLRTEAPRAVAPVARVTGHGGVAAGGTKEPFAVGSWLHEFELFILDAIGAADGGSAIALDSLYACDQRVARFMHGKAMAIASGGGGSERFGADNAACDFGVHRYQYGTGGLRRLSG